MKRFTPNYVDHRAKIGENVQIGQFCFIGECEIGDNVKIQPGTFIPNNVIIGPDVFIGPNVTFTNDKHAPSNGLWKQERPTKVRSGVSIGANATILPNLDIGTNAIIGAGAVVTKNVPPGRTVCGNPAR